MPSLKKSLFIGLGGTGVKSILYAKAKIKAIYGEIPPMVRFLALDTDKYKPIRLSDEVEVSLEANEYLHMQVPNGLQFIKANDHAAEFFPEKNLKNAGAIVRGAGQIRSLGRLALMRNYHEVQKRLNEEILQLRNFAVGYNDKFSTSGNDLQISVICSTSGGTGAGTFLDIPYIMKNTGQLSNQDRLIAYLLFPDIFKQFSGTRNVEPNCYASFKELDFMLEGHLAGQYIDYGRQQHVPIEGGPYDIVFTVNNVNNKNDAYTEPTDLNNFIGTGLFLSTGIISEKGDSTWDNLGKQVDDFLAIEQKAPHYCSFGISELYYNGSVLSEIYARKLSLQVIDRLTGGHEDLSKLVNEKIDEWEIRENNDADQVIDAILSRTSKRSPETMEKYSKGASKEIQTLATNFINAVTDNAEAKASEGQNELATKKMVVIDEYLENNLNRENGLSFVLNFLDQFLGMMNAHKIEMETEKKEFIAQRDKLVGSYKNFVADIEDAEDSFFFKRSKNIQLACEDYMAEVTREANLVHEIKRREKAYLFFNKLVQYCEEKKLKYESLRSDLSKVYSDFQEFIQTQEFKKGATKPFIINLHEDHFDKTTPAPNDLSFGDLINTLNEKGMPISSWSSLKLAEIEEVLLDYTRKSSKAQVFTDKSLDSVMNELPLARRRQIIHDLDRRAEPLWRYNKSYILETATIYLIGLNSMDQSALFVEEEGRQLVDTIPGRKSYAVTNEANRIYFYKMEAAAPAFTIANMQQYKQKYDNQNARYDYHVDRKWSKLMEQMGYDIFPSGEDEDNVLSWALSNAFGFIVKEGRKAYQIKSPQTGSPTSDYWVSLGAEDRKEAFDAFSKRKFNREMNEMIERKMKEIGEAETSNRLEEYTSTFMERIKEFTSLDEKTINSRGYQEVKALIDKELKTLQNYINTRKTGF